MQTTLINRFQARGTASAVLPSLETRSNVIPARAVTTDPTYLAKKIIGQQWHYRNHRDPAIRLHAQTMIRSHIVMLRQWRKAAIEI